MLEEYKCLVGKDILYFLLVEPEYYKFGITRNMYNRMATHKRTLKFTEVIKIFHCFSRESSFRIEQKFKKYATSIGILVTRYGQTEIICTNEPQKYIEWFENEIVLEQKLLIANTHRFELPRLILPKFKIPKIRELIFPKRDSGLEQSKVLMNVVKITNEVAKNQVEAKQRNKLELANKNFNCNKCGQVFKLEKHLRQHSARKTPCVINPDLQVGDNKCIYCNHVYSTKYTLDRHSRKCKMKNGGIVNIPDPNIRLAEQIRVLAEEREKEKEEQKKKEEEQKKKDEKHSLEMEELRALIKELLLRPPAAGTINNAATVTNIRAEKILTL